MNIKPPDDGLERPLLNSNAEPSATRRASASLSTRLAPLLLSLTGLVLAILVCAAGQKQWYITSSSPAYPYIKNNRTEVQTVLHIYASLFAFLWSYSVCSSFNLWMRQLLDCRVQTVDRLRLLVSISKRTVDPSLSKPFFTLSCIAFAIGLLPAWLWTGAITPTQATKTEPFTVTIPEPANGTYPQPIMKEACTLAMQSNGTFSNCPGVDLLANLVYTMGAAARGQGYNHTKIDSTGYTYNGPSYGAGASVNLTGRATTDDMLYYNFTQTGFVTNVTCQYNTSSLWNFDADPIPIPNSDIYAFTVHGLRPNQPIDTPFSYPYLTENINGSNIVAFSADGVWRYTPDLQGYPPYMLAIAAGTDFKNLNQTQCAFEITQKLVEVIAHIDSKTITVTPKEGQAKDVDPHFRQRVMAVTNIQFMTAEVGFYRSSPIGEALTKIATNQDVLYTTARAMEAVMDDIFAAYAGYALSQGLVSQQETKVYKNAYALGSRPFHILLLLVNVTGFAFILAITIYSRLYAQSPAFDFADACAVMIAAHNGVEMKDHVPWTGKGSDFQSRHSRWMINSRPGYSGSPRITLRRNRAGVEMSATSTGLRSDVLSPSTPASAMSSGPSTDHTYPSEASIIR